MPPTRVFSPTTDDDRVIASLSVASTPGKPTLKMSPFSALEPSNKIRSRSVSDQKEKISEISFVETGAPPDVIQLRKEEIFDPILNKNIESEYSKNLDDNTHRNFENDLITKKEEFIPKNSDDTKIVTNSKGLEYTSYQANEPNKVVKFEKDSNNSDSKDFDKSGTIVQQSKLPRPTTIGSLKNPHLPAANNKIAIHSEKNNSGNLNLETSKIKTVNLNDTNITFEGVHFSVVSTDHQKHLKEDKNHISNSQVLKEKSKRLDIENRPRNRNIGKIEDDNANLSDEGIMVGDVNSNANSEASNSPLPPVSSNTEHLNIDDEQYLNHKPDESYQLNMSSGTLSEDANCNNSTNSTERSCQVDGMNRNNKTHESLSTKCIQNSNSPNNNDKNGNNNNDVNVSTPSMSSPCDDRVPSRIPLSVE